MSDEPDRDLQAWFRQSDDDAATDSLAPAVLAQIQRGERRRQRLRVAALLTLAASVALLLPELAAPFVQAVNQIGALPLTVAIHAGEQWPLLLIATLGMAPWIYLKARNAGLWRRA